MLADFLVRHASFSAADCFRNHFWFMLHFPEAVIVNKSVFTFFAPITLFFTRSIMAEPCFNYLLRRLAKDTLNHFYRLSKKKEALLFKYIPKIKHYLFSATFIKHPSNQTVKVRVHAR